MNDEMQWRENIEWQNIWWEQANNTEVKRIALLGDSVTRGFRSKLNEKVGGEYAVDLCASSSQLTDGLLWREYKFFFDCSEWQYSKILMQGGAQHGHARRCCEDEEYLQIYKSSYRKLVKRIMTYCSDVLLVSSTPCVEKDELTKWNDYRNEELAKRNQITMEVAKEFNLSYIDIWTPLMKEKFEYSDYIHMKADGNEFIARFVTNFLCEGYKI